MEAVLPGNKYAFTLGVTGLNITNNMMTVGNIINTNLNG
jgi:hypothetical protein